MKYDYRKDMTEPAASSRNIARSAGDIKKTYLFLYNLTMFVSFSFVTIVLWIEIFTKTLDDSAIAGATRLVKILTYMQLLETVHGAIGLVPGGPMTAFTQVVGRLIVNSFLSHPEIRQDAYPFAHTLMLVWSFIEIFRYSFYALRVFNVDIYPITWARYSLFMVLYPMGGFSEAMILRSASKIVSASGRLSYRLPNKLNISFDLPFALAIYSYVILPPTILYLMRYMYSQRCRQLKKIKEKVL